jgi:hypothetical protein
MSADTTTASQPRLLQSLDTSPTIGQLNNGVSLNPEEDLDLTRTVRELVRSDNLELKTSLELKL